MFTVRALPFALALTTALVFACDSDNGPDGSEGLDEDKSLGMTVWPGILNVVIGTNGSGTVRVTRGTALMDPIQLSATGVPAGVTVTFVPEALTGEVVEAEMIVAVAQTASPGSQEVTVRAAAAAVATASRVFLLVIVPPGTGSFSVSPAGGAFTVYPDGEPRQVTLTITRRAPFAGVVSFELANLPPGRVATVSPTSTAGSTVTLSVSAPPGAATDSYAFDLLAMGEGLPGSFSYRWSVTITNPTAPALRLTFDPAELTVVAGGPSATTTLNIERVNFTGPVACWEEAGSIMFPNDLDMTLGTDYVETATSIAMTVRAPGTMVPGVYEAGAVCWASDTGSPVSGEMMTVIVTVAP